MNDKPYPFTPDQEAWLRDLETTVEPQTVSYLHRLIGDDEFGARAGYCCLGRACVVLGIPECISVLIDDVASTFNGHDTYLPPEAYGKLGLGKSAQEDLVQMNDRGLSFKQIAAAVRADPDRYFSDCNPEYD